jgi:hypothetical protein
MENNKQASEDIEQELINQCTCDGPWGREGCPVHGKNSKDKPNQHYDSWQIEMMHWGATG